MDDVPVMLCRLGGRVGRPPAREVDRQLDGRYLACSRQLVDEVEAGGVRLRPDVEVVPNWVVGEPPAPRARFYRPGQTLRIIAAGQIAQHKGVDILIEAAARVRDRGFENIQVDIYGNVEDHFFPTLVRRLGLDDHVSFQGSRPQADLARLYPPYDVFAFPTWHREPFAFAPLEASLAGLRPPDVAAQRQRRMGRPRGPLPEGRPHARRLRRLALLDPGRLGQPGADRPEGRRRGRPRLPPRRPGPQDRAGPGRGRRRPRAGAGTASEAYRMALLAEKLTKVLVQEAGLRLIAGPRRDRAARDGGEDGP